MKEDEECHHEHTLNDDCSATDGDKENYSVGEDNSNTCKDVVIETKLMQSQVEGDLHEDVELQSEPQHALDGLKLMKHENIDMPFSLMYSPL